MFLPGRFQNTAFHGDAVHIAAVAVIIVNRLVPCRAVVPHRHVPRRPADTRVIFRLLAFAVNHFENMPGFARAHPLDMGGEVRVDIDPFAPRKRMVMTEYLTKASLMAEKFSGSLISTPVISAPRKPVRGLICTRCLLDLVNYKKIVDLVLPNVYRFVMGFLPILCRDNKPDFPGSGLAH